MNRPKRSTSGREAVTLDTASADNAELGDGGRTPLPESGMNLSNPRSRERLITLAREFRYSLRQFMSAPEMLQALEKRVNAELRGKMPVKITPVILRICAGTQGVVNKEQQGQAPLFNIHLHHLSDEQLKKIAEKGLKPRELLPAQGPVIDVKGDPT